MVQVSIIIPAFNEQERISKTLAALEQTKEWIKEIIVVDDGSTDRTCELALHWTPSVIRLERNRGKGKAVQIGAQHASQSILLFLDADLGETAGLWPPLAKPVWQNQADMTVAIFPPAYASGFGLVKRLAAWGIYKKTGFQSISPLCGQRAVKKEVFEQCYQGDQGYGLEVGLTLDCLSQGYRIQELEIPFQHRQTGRDAAGFMHRMRQGLAVGQALLRR